ncbi:hypothetical protein [Niallia sp. FSL W8-0635]|uniref:hypothetical protein n=1 Tax=Niallia sp. FSL W8-0635 TaxID=2975337 RepID=UPI0009CF9E34|nr:Uncharacterised protein [Mycobacteroides abscessus subsp. abscessus]HEO8420307.1 hypothetical protein [Yersinia enterocolitica]
MLSFEEKLKIIESFPKLERKNVSLKRVNFHYVESGSDKKNVVYHLHPNGNGFVYADKLNEYDTDDKGMVNIRDFSEEELREIIEKSIQSLEPSTLEGETIEEESMEEEKWVDSENNTLLLLQEEGFWNIYAGVNLENSFSSYMEACEYLKEEDFNKSHI